MRTHVHKFGGTSVTGATRISSAADLLVADARSARIVAVASAMSGVTDSLVAAARDAGSRERERSVATVPALHARHIEALDALLSSSSPYRGEPERGADAASVRAELERLLDELRALLLAVTSLGELTLRTRDRVLATGEKLSCRLLAFALRDLGARAQVVDADSFLETDGVAGEASPIPGITEAAIARALGARLDAGELPVVTGFVGRAPDGCTTTLGRGGSDYTATLLGAGLRADEVTIWTDVDGVFTADPRWVPGARLIPQLNYREAAELSFYGAKVLHQRTIIPVAGLQIPVLVRNSFAPDHPRTVVDGRCTPGSHPVKAISAVRDQALVDVEGRGMSGVPGVARRVFEALSAASISVTMISQSSSESSITLAVPGDRASDAEVALKREFRADIARGDIEDVEVTRGVALLAAVGLGMAHTPGVAARLFGALARRRANVLAIAQGSSELNISVALDQRDLESALRALHDEFGLARQDTGAEDPDGFDLILFGAGKVGRALISLLLDRNTHFFERFALRPRVVAVCDRSGWVFRPTGLTRAELEGLCDGKRDGRSLASLPGATSSSDPTAMLREAAAWRLTRPLLVDVSDWSGGAALMSLAFSLGFDVVTANKHPLASSREEFDALRVAQGQTARLLRAEATVGAGLPVVDTLEMLLATGDRLFRAEGCLSGTLGFLMTRVGDGARFSDAVREAADAGYTEPDPVADLTGHDVARKALILSRLSKLAPSDPPVSVEGLVDPSLAGLPPNDLFDRLRALDDAIAARARAARDSGLVLRYVARVDAGAIRVGPEAVAPDSPAGRMRGTDNMIVFHSERYRDRPLVVSGPGAGVEVTAMGVLTDLLRVAAERR